MPEQLKLSELRYGLQASPGFQGNRLAPYKIVNIEINPEGRAVLRAGYSVSTQAFEGNDDQLVVAHFVADRHNPARTLYKRIDLQDHITIFGRRMFTVGESEGLNAWTDVDLDRTYQWELIKPTVPPTLELNLGNVQTGATGAVYGNIVNFQFGFEGRNSGRASVTVAGLIPIRLVARDENGEERVSATPLTNVDQTLQQGGDTYYLLERGIYEFEFQGISPLHLIYLDFVNQDR